MAETPRPVEVHAKDSYRLWIRYDDGIEGEVDLSDLAGRGVFTAWDDVAFFESVRIAPHGAISWGDDLELCPDSMYLRLTGKSPGDVFERSDRAEVDA